MKLFLLLFFFQVAYSYNCEDLFCNDRNYSREEQIPNPIQQSKKLVRLEFFAKLKDVQKQFKNPKHQKFLLELAQKVGINSIPPEVALITLDQFKNNPGKFIEGPSEKEDDENEASLPEAYKKEYEGTILDKIGYGGYSQVYLARNKSDKLVAVKFFNANSFFVFKKELETLEAVQNLPHAVKMISSKVLSSGDLGYIEFEYVEGSENLVSYINKKIARKYDYYLESNLKIAREILLSLQEIHNTGYVHGDIKLDNYLVKDGKITLLDFGLAQKVSILKTVTYQYGSPSYRAPEITNYGILSSKADIYSAGVTLCGLFTGKSEAFSRTNAPTLRQALKLADEKYPYLPKSLVTLLFKMLTPNPLFRISAKEALKELEAI